MNFDQHGLAKRTWGPYKGRDCLILILVGIMYLPVVGFLITSLILWNWIWSLVAGIIFPVVSLFSFCLLRGRYSLVVEMDASSDLFVIEKIPHRMAKLVCVYYRREEYRLSEITTFEIEKVETNDGEGHTITTYRLDLIISDRPKKIKTNLELGYQEDLQEMKRLVDCYQTLLRGQSSFGGTIPIGSGDRNPNTSANFGSGGGDGGNGGGGGTLKPSATTTNTTTPAAAAAAPARAVSADVAEFIELLARANPRSALAEFRHEFEAVYQRRATPAECTLFLKAISAPPYVASGCSTLPAPPYLDLTDGGACANAKDLRPVSPRSNTYAGASESVGAVSIPPYLLPTGACVSDYAWSGPVAGSTATDIAAYPPPAAASAATVEGSEVLYD